MDNAKLSEQHRHAGTAISARVIHANQSAHPQYTHGNNKALKHVFNGMMKRSDGLQPHRSEKQKLFMIASCRSFEQRISLYHWLF